MITVKAISLWEPWAWLIFAMLKQNETRHWTTPYRGLLAIHAAQKWTGQEKETWRAIRERFGNLLGMDAAPATPPLGAVLCVVRLVDVQPTWLVRTKITAHERAFGNYEHGRYAWKLEMVKRFDEPIPYKGAQGFFDVKLPDSLAVK